MNTEAIRKQISGAKPLLVLTADGRRFNVPSCKFVGLTRSYLMIEDRKCSLDIVDHEEVVSIRRHTKRKRPKDRE